eukprot:14296385-Alexandrium_andersonii.AAC.1
MPLPERPVQLGPIPPPLSCTELHRRRAVGRRAKAWVDEDRGHALKLLPREAAKVCEAPERQPVPEGVPHIWNDPVNVTSLRNHLDFVALSELTLVQEHSTPSDYQRAARFAMPQRDCGL